MMSLLEYIDDEEVKNMLFSWGFFLYFFGKSSLKNGIKFDLVHSLEPS